MPSWLKELLLRARYLGFRKRVEREIDLELDFHIHMRTIENIQDGMSPKTARKDAFRRFGNMAYIKDNCRDERGAGFIEVLLRDIRFGARMLARNPGFTAVILVTLAVGVGATSLIFSVVNAVLINPLPYRQPDRIVELWERSPTKHWEYNVCAPANYLDWKSQNHSFQLMAAYIGGENRGPGVSNLSLTQAGSAEIVHGLFVTGELFSVLGVEPMLGRAFVPDETWEGKDAEAVLSYPLWKNRFGGDPGLVGKTIQLNGQSRTVIGVMPRDFYFPTADIDLWIPMGWNQNQIASVRRPHFIRVIARLKDGVPVEAAQAEITAIAANLEKQYPGTNTKMGAGLGPVKEWIVQQARPAVLIFLTAVGFVLLIGCANVASLLLSRSAVRSREMAVRAALGAGRSRLARQLLTECLLLAMTGGGLGLVLAIAGRRLLTSFNPGNIPRFDDLSLDWKVVAFTIVVSLISSLIFGLAPAISVSRPDLVSTLKEGGRGGSSGIYARRARRAFVVGEIALSTILVIGAGLMIRSFERLQRVHPGFVPSGVLTLRISLPGTYKTPEQGKAYFDEVARRIGGITGVRSVGMITSLPLTGTTWTSDFTIEGRPAGEYGVEVRHESVTPDYFVTMETPLVKGRWLTDEDKSEDNAVILINEALAKRYFPNEDPIGKRLKPSKPEVQNAWETIVGVVGDEKQDGLGVPVAPGIYEAFAINPFSDMNLVIRASQSDQGLPSDSVKSLIDPVREQIRAVDNNVPPYNVQSMQEVVYKSAASERFSLLLLSAFAGIALVLAGVGVYGVMSYTVTQQTREIGIRMALGAGGREVLGMVVRQGAGVTAIGLGIGFLGAVALTRLMSGLLYSVAPRDPLTFVIVGVFLALVAVMSCAVPARRATRVDPMTALHYE